MVKQACTIAIIATFGTVALPGALLASIAEYEVTFLATWSAATHPTDFPSNPHFSGLVGGTHNSLATFWDLGGIATQGIEEMAELGRKTVLLEEVNAAIGNASADETISGGGISPSPGSRTLTFPVRSHYPLVTLVSMVAPSPDWFVGVDALDMRDNGGWRDDIVVDLYSYDAGTDGGPTFTSQDDDTDPHDPIALLDGFPFEDAPPMGTFTFRLLSVMPPVPGDLDSDGDADFDDIDEFVMGLNDSAAYNAIFDESPSLTGDTDGDGDLDFDDISGFVNLLGDGGIAAGINGVPEPSSIALATAALLAFAYYASRHRKGEDPLFRQAVEAG